MVVFKYDDGTGEPAELEPLDNEFEYVAAGDYWAIKRSETDAAETMVWIPNHRIYEVQGLRSKIHHKRP